MGRKSCLIKSLRSVPVPWHKLSLHHAIQRSDVPINISGHFSFKRRTSYSPLLVLPPPQSFICFYFSSLHSLSYPFSSSSSLHSLSYIPCFPLPPFNLLSLSPAFTLYHIPFLPLLVPPALPPMHKGVPHQPKSHNRDAPSKSLQKTVLLQRQSRNALALAGGTTGTAC